VKGSLRKKKNVYIMEVAFSSPGMPVTYYDEDIVRRVIELRKRGWGYRRIGHVVGISKDAAMRIWKAYGEGRIKLRGDGAVEFVHKPAGVIKYQEEGLWDPRTRSFVMAPKPLPEAQYNALARSAKSHRVPNPPSEGHQKLFKIRVPKPEGDIFKEILLSLHGTFSVMLPTELPPPPPAPPIPPKSIVQELLYAKLPCPNCGERIHVKPPEGPYDLRRRVLCEKCGALIEVEFVN